VCGGGGLDDEGEGVEERGAAVLAERGDTALLDVPAIDADDGESCKSDGAGAGSAVFDADYVMAFFWGDTESDASGFGVEPGVWFW